MMLYPGSVGSQTYVADVRVRYVLMVSDSTYILTTVAGVTVNIVKLGRSINESRTHSQTEVHHNHR